MPASALRPVDPDACTPPGKPCKADDPNRLEKKFKLTSNSLCISNCEVNIEYPFKLEINLDLLLFTAVKFRSFECPFNWVLYMDSYEVNIE